jgi:hypothetical protein
MFAEFRLYHSPFEAGEIFEIFEHLTRIAQWHGKSELTVGFSAKVCSIDKRFGGFYESGAYMGCLGGRIPP